MDGATEPAYIAVAAKADRTDIHGWTCHYRGYSFIGDYIMGGWETFVALTADVIAAGPKGNVMSAAHPCMGDEKHKETRGRIARWVEATDRLLDNGVE
tara:strand:+ start:36482 stop:36775 length:294 start_codon:yes stop_codon:yes gene_type:complete